MACARGQAAGVTVTVYGHGAIDGLKSHGKMMLIDGQRAAIGSISLSPPSLGKRRELALLVDEPESVAQFASFLERLGRGAPLALRTEAGNDDENEDEESEDE